MRRSTRRKLKVYAVDAAMILLAAQVTIVLKADNKAEASTYTAIQAAQDEYIETRSDTEAPERDAEYISISEDEQNWSRKDSDILLRIAMAEAEGEGTEGQYLKDSSLAKRGDINLNTGHHVNVTVDNGSNAGKGSATNTSTTKSTATLTNKIEVQLPVLKKGSKGVAVSMLQAMLNVNVDGDFGDDTKNALKVFQSNVKIAADGICGADTWKKVVEHMKTSTQ